MSAHPTPHPSSLHRLGYFLFGGLLAAQLFAVSPTPADVLQTSVQRSESLLARPELAAYRGWLKFLRFEAQTAAHRDGAASESAIAKAQRLAEWTARIEADPTTLAQLTGVQEWAYESPVDGSGQPFKFVIPSDYSSARPAPLAVYMHGYGGNHLEHATGMVPHPGFFEVSVLGRARGGQYRALSEADVLHVIDYIEAHWRIDPDRVTLNGGSMGGGGTYRLGSRYPHRFASGRPVCGFASYVPVGNLLTLPLYATHSADDYVVSVLHDRGPLALLRDIGGQVILDETNGYGHAAWDYKEGNARGLAWERRQVRHTSREVRHIDYTALDGAATRGWWGEIVDWGDAPQPARFVLVAGANNTLFATLTNITRLRLRLAESPLEAARPAHIVINGAVPLTLPAPLPAEAVLAHGATGWAIEANAPASPVRRHTPGSANLLYDGEPLLIVYGTTGNEETRRALRAAAEIASKSPNAAWTDDPSELGPDKTQQLQNLYGQLTIKADSDVTAADIARSHLVLIGTAAQNTLVAQLADRLPVRLADHQIICTDGFTLPATDRALGLVHFNPLAPQRLLFWVASDNLAAYAPNAAVPLFMSGSRTPCGADFVVTAADHPELVVARSLDGRWQWTHTRDASPLVPATITNHRGIAAAVAEAIRRQATADFAINVLPPFADAAAIAPGTTRVDDVLAIYYRSPIGLFDVSGAEVQRIARAVAANTPPTIIITDSPACRLADVKPEAMYRVALPADALWPFGYVSQSAPASYRQTDLMVRDALERYLAQP